MKYLYPFLFIAMLLHAPIMAQEQALQTGTSFIQNYAPKQYAEVSVSPQNWAIIRDNRGILYVGNTEGLLEYDGINWRIIKTSNNSIVRSLAKNEQGRIFVGASGDFGYLVTDSKGKKRYKSLMGKVPEEFHDFTNVWNCEVFGNKVYFVTNSRVYKYEEDTVKVIPFTQSNKRLISFKLNDQLYFSQTNGLYKLEDESFKLMPGSEGIGFTFTMPYKNNSILAQTQNGEWVTYNTEPSNTDSLIKRTNAPITDTLSNVAPYYGLKISENSYAVATYRSGIFVFTGEGRLNQVINNNYGLRSDAVYTLYVDNRNHLWAGLESGFANIDLESPITLFNQAHGLDGTPISMINDPRGLYIGTTHGLFTNTGINNSKNSFEKLPGVNGTIWAFDQSNNELVVASSQGLYQVTPEHNMRLIYQANTATGKFSGRFFNMVFIGLWDGMKALKLNFSEETGGPIAVTDTINFPEINSAIRKITEDEDGNLWLSTDYKGLIKLNFHSNSPRDYEIIHYNKNDGLPKVNNNLVYNVNQTIYVGTRQGVFVPKKQRATSHDSTIRFVPEPTFGNIFTRDSMTVLQILANGQKERYVFAEKVGFGKIYQENGEWQWDMTPFKKIPARAIYRYYIDKSNVIWAIGSENIYRYDPGVEKSYDVDFNTIIRKVSSGDSRLFYGSSGPDTTALSELPHNENAVVFEFSAPFFDREDEIEYQYQLVGFEEGWSDWTQNHIKEYTNLPSGEYLFKVRGRNIYGNKSKTATFKLIIYPAWYNTVYAYMGYGLIAIILFYALVVLYSRRLKQTNQRLEKLVNERTERLQKQKEEIAKQNEAILKQNAESSRQKKEIQKQTRELERKNEELQNLSIVARETDNAILITDPDGNFEWVNKGYTRIFGLTFEQLLQKSKNIIGPDTPEHVKEKIKHAKENKETIYYDFSTKSPEGKDIYVQATLTPVVNDYGKVVKIVAVDADITRVKKAEEEIKQQKTEIEKQRDSYKKQKNKVERAYKNIKLLSDFGQKITSTLDMDAINNMIFDYVNDVMKIDAFGIGEYNDIDKIIEFKGFMEKGIPAPYFNFKLAQDNSLVVWAFENRQDLLINDLENEYAEYVSKKPTYETKEQPKSAIIIPLVVESRPIGIVTAQSYNKDAFSVNDLSVIKSLASYIAIALENTRVYKLIKNKNQHINASIRYAKTLQQAILPNKANIDEVFNSFVFYQPKEVVSGDFYWFREISQPNTEAAFYFMAVVDCTGHGVPGAFMSIIANRILNEIIENEVYEPDQILRELNKRVIEVLNQDENDNNDGMDVALAKFERVHSEKTIVTFAGAKRPLYYFSTKDNALVTVRGDRKSIGGVRAINKNQDYSTNELLLSSNDKVYLTTDGLIDQHGADRKRFGSPRLKKLLEKNAMKSMDKQQRAIEEALKDYMQDEDPRDDMTIIGLEC